MTFLMFQNILRFFFLIFRVGATNVRTVENRKQGNYLFWPEHIFRAGAKNVGTVEKQKQDTFLIGPYMDSKDAPAININKATYRTSRIC